MAKLQAPELQRLFGQAVRETRESRGLTQEQLAFASGINRSYIGDIERGARNVSLLNIVRLSNALGVSTSALFEAMEV